MSFFYSKRLNKPVSRGAIRAMYGHRVDGWEADDFTAKGFLPAERTPINVNRFLSRKAESEGRWEEVDGVYRQVWEFEDVSEDSTMKNFATRVVADEAAKRLSDIEGLRSAYPDDERIKKYIDELKALIDQPPQELAWAIEQGTDKGWPAKPDAVAVMTQAREIGE
jgi:hypothetical protein